MMKQNYNDVMILSGQGIIITRFFTCINSLETFFHIHWNSQSCWIT